MTSAVGLTWRGRGVVLAGCALLGTGFITQIAVAVAAGVFALMVSASSVGWALLRRRGVRISRLAPPATSEAGQEVHTKASITVGRPDFATAIVRDLTPGQTNPPAVDDVRKGGGAIVRLDRTEVLVEGSFVPHRRGLVQWPHVRVELPDPLGIAAGIRLAPRSGRTVVFPRTVPLARGVAGVATGDSDLDVSPSSRLIQGDPGLVPRAYQIGDELRRVHWPATARVGEPMVRSEEPRSARTAVVAIESSSAGYHDPEAFERAITACASIAELLLDQGWTIRVQTIRGKPLSEQAWLLGVEGRYRLLAALAVLQLDSSAEVVRQSSLSSGDTLIVVQGAHSRAVSQALIALCTETNGEADGPAALIWDGSVPLSTIWATASNRWAVT